MLIVRTHFPPIHFCKGSCGKGHWGSAWPAKRGGMGEGREAVVQLGRRRCIWTVVIATGWLSQKVPWQRALQCSEGRCSLKPLVPAEGQYMLLLTPQYKHTYTSMTWKWLRDPQYCSWCRNCTALVHWPSVWVSVSCRVPRTSEGSPCLLVGGGGGGERYTVPPAVAGTTVALDDTHLQNLWAQNERHLEKCTPKQSNKTYPTLQLTLSVSTGKYNTTNG